MIGLVERADKNRKECGLHVLCGFEFTGTQTSGIRESKFPAIHKSGKLKSCNSKVMVNHPIARENIIHYVLILSHSLWGCHDHLPTNVIHQKNSNPLVIAGFKGFHDLLNHIKIKGGVKCHTNRESPCI